MRDVFIQEVGLRDGLQGIATFFPTEGKLAWCRAVAAAGVPVVEACSFVPASLFPQFADGPAVLAAALAIPGLTVSALAPNLKGAERAFAAGIHQLNFVASASRSHNARNVGRSPEESLKEFRRIVELRAATPAFRHIRLVGGIATAFGCSIDGRIDEDEVLRLAEAFVAAGADEVALADTVGYGSPMQVKRLFTRAAQIVGDRPLSAHFHDTRGLGLANAMAAYEAGVRRFDASSAGLGGCPAAPGATGNVVLQDLVFMFEACGLRTGIDVAQLTAIRGIIATHLPNEKLYGTLAIAGLPKSFVPASEPSAKPT